MYLFWFQSVMLFFFSGFSCVGCLAFSRVFLKTDSVRARGVGRSFGRRPCKVFGRGVEGLGNGTERFWEWYGTILGMVRNHSMNSTEPFLSLYCMAREWHGGRAREKRKRGCGFTAPPAPDFMQLKSTRCTLYTHSHKNTY